MSAKVLTKLFDFETNLQCFDRVRLYWKRFFFAFWNREFVFI